MIENSDYCTEWFEYFRNFSQFQGRQEDLSSLGSWPSPVLVRWWWSMETRVHVCLRTQRRLISITSG